LTGDYNPDTKAVHLHTAFIGSAKELLETAIRQYACHLMNEDRINGEFAREKPFRDYYNRLVDKAEQKGVFHAIRVPDRRISQIVDKWFLREPLLLAIFLSRELKPDFYGGTCRCGKGRIEYDPGFFHWLPLNIIEELLKTEIIRILLRHPYRLPPEHDRRIAGMASNITLNEYYPFNLSFHVNDFWREENYHRQNYEFYYRELVKILPPRGGNDLPDEDDESESPRNDDSAGAESENLPAGSREKPAAMVMEEAEKKAFLWENDEYMDLKISDLVKQAVETRSWGTIPQSLRQIVIAGLRPVIDYRKILRNFRASILSSEKKLTGFRPSRRYGWTNMGKKSQLVTRLLAGVDVSGSVSDRDVALFFSTINRFFKYGIESIDVLQFDADIKGKPVIMKKARKEIQLTGRGGTNFQPIIDYFAAGGKSFDGLIIFTDGFAPVPEAAPATVRKTLWICNTRQNYGHHYRWMKNLGRCCWIGED
jgi:predicted metal-dependent peptidase